MSYHSPTPRAASGKKVLSGGTANAALSTRVRAPGQATVSAGTKSVNTSPVKLDRPVLPTISMDELGLATEAEKNRKGYLSTFLEGQTSNNKISNFLGR